jgi:hypothetical protein
MSVPSINIDDLDGVVDHIAAHAYIRITHRPHLVELQPRRGRRQP